MKLYPFVSLKSSLKKREKNVIGSRACLSNEYKIIREWVGEAANEAAYGVR